MNSFLLKPCLYLIASLSFFCYQSHALADNSNEKLPTQWQQRNTLQFPLRMIVEYQDTSLKSAEQSFKQNTRLSATEKKQFQKQLASSYTTLKHNIMSIRHIKNQNIYKDYSHLPMNTLIIENNEQLQNLLDDTHVKSVYPDILLYANVLQSKALIEADKAELNLAADGRGSTVVVLDSGVNFSHADFGNCSAPGIPENCRVIISTDFAPDDNQNDSSGHGSNVAGIVASIAKGVDLIVFDVFNGTSASSSDVIDGINWAIANQATYNIAAINMSLGSATKYTSPCDNPLSNPYKTPIQNAKNAGILSIVAAGNDGYTNGISLPSCVSNAVSVGAVYDSNIGGITWSTTPNCTDSSTAADQVTCFSNSASFLKLMAPGARIIAGGFNQGGTSQAAPHVTALAAILHSAYPNESTAELESRMINSGTIITDIRNGLGFPRINAWKAVGAINNAFDDAFVLSSTSTLVQINTENADKQNGEPNHAGLNGGKSVWFAFSSAVSGTLTVDTQSSNFDTLMAIYTGASVDSLTLISDNNDSGTPNGPSQIELPINANTIYQIAVDDAANIGGELQLNLSFLEAEQVPILSNWNKALMLALLLLIISIYEFRRKKYRIPTHIK